jgi:hypothetical protein
MKLLLISLPILVVFCFGCSKKAANKPVPEIASPLPGSTAPSLTKDNNSKLSDDDLESAVTGLVLGKIGTDYSNLRQKFDSWSPGLQMVYATTDLEGEVYNGGFHQYFYNSEGEFMHDALQAYKLIGATEHAKLVAKAIILADKEKLLRAEVRQKGDLKFFADSYKQTKLGDLDDVFYGLDKTEDPRALRAKYIRAHPEEFLSW